jgi:hypothetical protein
MEARKGGAEGERVARERRGRWVCFMGRGIMENGRKIQYFP